MAPPPRSDIWRWVALALIAAAAGYLAWRLELVIITILLAAMLAYVLKPAVDAVRRLPMLGAKRHMSPVGATLVVYAVTIAVLWGIALILANPLRAEISNFQGNWPSYQAQVPDLLQRIEQYYATHLPASTRRLADAEMARMVGLITSGLAKVVQAAFLSVSEAVGWLVELLLVPILAFYFLSDLPSLKEAVFFFLPAGRRPAASRILGVTDRVFARFVRGQVILCVIAWVVVTLGLFAVGMPSYVTLGLLAGITRAVPIVGPVVAGVPIVLLASLKSPVLGFWVLVGYSFLHFFESKYLMPRVLGFHLGIHPVLVIVSLLVGYELFGIVGMFVAVPLVAIAKLVMKQQRGDAPAASHP
jgi:predicted PurR-regulated permease PerM